MIMMDAIIHLFKCVQNSTECTKAVVKLKVNHGFGVIMMSCVNVDSSVVTNIPLW